MRMEAEFGAAGPPPAPPTLAEENIALRVEWEMRRRGWSQEHIAKEMAGAGCPLHQSAISKIINARPDGKRRTISFDEAIAFAKIFEIPIEELALPLEIAQSQEIHVLIGEIEDLLSEWSTVIDKVGFAWLRLADLLADDVILSGYVEWLRKVKKVSYDDARRQVKDWVDRAGKRQEYLADRERPLRAASDKNAKESNVYAVTLRSLMHMRRWIQSIRTSEIKSVRTFIDWYAPSIRAAELSHTFAPLINRQIDGRHIDDELIEDAVANVDRRVASIANGPALTDREKREKIGAQIIIRSQDGESRDSISADFPEEEINAALSL